MTSKLHSKICIVGEVVVDLHPSTSNGNKVSIGGIFHSARALASLNLSFDMLFISPKYLDEHILEIGKKYGAQNLIKIGEVTGAPNMLIIGEPQETGDQKYDLVLASSYKCELETSTISEYLNSVTPSEVLITTGQYDLRRLTANFGTFKDINFSADISNGVDSISAFEDLGFRFKTVFTSYSTKLFKTVLDGQVEKLIHTMIPSIGEELIFKENRGGARMFFRGNEQIKIGAQLTNNIHSVGVGDVFNAVFLQKRMEGCNNEQSLNYASWIAAEYAFNPNITEFSKNVERINKIPAKEIHFPHGLSLPWEERRGIKIYIAGPDFNDSYKPYFDKLHESLIYHNFTPYLPIRENGLVTNASTKSERRKAYADDIKLISDSSLLIAFIPYNDQGTLVEIGIAHEKKIPILLYDPFKVGKNNMLMETVAATCLDMNTLINKVFEFSKITHG